MVYLLFTDETNQQPAPNAKFFIYGGVFFPVEQLTELHALVEQARCTNGFQESDELKFDSRSCPKHVTKKQHTAAKNAVLKGCTDLGVRFISYLILHAIVREQDLKDLVVCGLSTVLSAFNRFLEEGNVTGICLVDRFPFKGDYEPLKDKFQTGLIFPNGRSRRLDRVHAFASTCQGASHASSVTDIVLGAFRYCVNETGKDIAPRAMFPHIANMMWHKRVGDKYYLREYGLLIRPKKVEVGAYQCEYDELVEHLEGLLKKVS